MEGKLGGFALLRGLPLSLPFLTLHSLVFSQDFSSIPFLLPCFLFVYVFFLFHYLVALLFCFHFYLFAYSLKLDFALLPWLAWYLFCSIG